MNSNQQNIKILLFLLFVSAVFVSCTEEAPPSLTPKDKELVDSFYIKELTRIKPIYDSICESEMDKRVKRAVDSMLIERRNEIGKQLERIKELSK